MVSVSIWKGMPVVMDQPMAVVMDQPVPVVIDPNKWEDF